MDLKYDDQGFLVGELIDMSKDMLRGQEISNDLLRQINANLSGGRGRGGSASGGGGGQSAGRSRPRTPAAPFMGPLPAVTAGRTPTVSTKAAVKAIGEAAAVSAVTAPGRDSRGRFVAGAGRGGARPLASGGKGDPGAPTVPSPKTPKEEKEKGIAREVAVDLIKNATDNIDPTIQAAKEIKDTLSPLGRGWKAAFGKSETQKKERWYKRLLKAITGSKGESSTPASSGDGDGLLSGLGGGAMGMLAKILPALATVLGPVLLVVMAGLAGLGIGKLISDWMDSSGATTKLLDAIDSMKAVWVDFKNWFAAKTDKAKEAVSAAKDSFMAGYDRGAGNEHAGAGRGSALDPRRLDGGGKKDLLEKVGEIAGGAVAGASSAIQSILQVGKGFNVVQKVDGTVVRQNGSRNWRNNNPGNIEFGDFAKSKGAIASDGRFAIFPDYASGRSAKESLIFEGKKYRDLDLKSAIARYAPPTENDTNAYQGSVLAAVGGSNRSMSSYSATERTAILNAMEKVEGFRVGTSAPVIAKMNVPPMPTLSANSIPKAPEVTAPSSATNGQAVPNIEIRREVSQDIADRSIAHIATGGLGKN